MRGIRFYQHLRGVLQHEQTVHDDGNYSFVEWTETGGLRYSVNNARNRQTKIIEPEILVMAVYWHERNIIITSQLLTTNGHTHWCTPPVLRFLLENYLVD